MATGASCAARLSSNRTNCMDQLKPISRNGGNRNLRRAARADIAESLHLLIYSIPGGCEGRRQSSHRGRFGKVLEGDPVDFAGGVERHGVEVDDLGGGLIADVAASELDELGGAGGRGALAQHDIGAN